MREETVRETIKKLLALGEGSNFEAEAQAALLKARELMAKYKISDIDNHKSAVVIHKTLDDIVFGAKTDLWINDLVTVICDAHGCKGAGQRFTKFSRHPVIYGFEDDVDICIEMIRFALSAINYEYNNAKNIVGKRATAAQLKMIRFSYGLGFANGLKAQYDKQNAEEGWGLVLTTPSEVEEVIKNFARTKISSSTKVDSNVYAKGYDDGKSFTKRDRIASRGL